MLKGTTVATVITLTVLCACGGAGGGGGAGESDAGELADVAGDVVDGGARDARADVDQLLDAGVDAPATALCCQVAQNIETCAPGAAWQCTAVATHQLTCDDPGCHVGDGCQDDFGSGTVVACGGQ